jgi:hypothetical protein
MPATIDRTKTNFFDRSLNYTRRVGIYTGPASYVTGGDPFVPADVKLGRIDRINFDFVLDANNVLYYAVYNYTTQVVIWYVATTGLQVAASTVLSALSTRFEAVGID